MAYYGRVGVGGNAVSDQQSEEAAAQRSVHGRITPIAMTKLDPRITAEGYLRYALNNLERGDRNIALNMAQLAVQALKGCI